VLAKIREELDEFEEQISESKLDGNRVEDELGDVLFAVANLARHMGVEPETALRRSNAKFVRRFRFIEQELQREGRKPSEASLDEMEAIWVRAKAEEPGR
jgi:ATP diphosphatase